MDHAAFIPFLIDTAGSIRNKPEKIPAIQSKFDTLREHLFNWRLWSDFTRISIIVLPCMHYKALALGGYFFLGMCDCSLPIHHAVFTTDFVFFYDTTTNDAF